MLTCVVREEDIASSDKVIHEYDQDVATNEKQLSDAKKDAEGKKVIDIPSNPAAWIYCSNVIFPFPVVPLTRL